MWVALAGLCGLISFVCSIMVLIHAFSKGGALQGILCLCIPLYILYYAFAKFEHPKKNMILAGMIGGVVLEVVFMMIGGVSMRPPVQ